LGDSEEMKPSLNSHIKELDSLRFLAILFVVANHLTINAKLYTLPLITHATSPVMACISSYLMFRTLNRPSQIANKLANRLRSLLLPYFLWTFLTFLIFQAIKSTLMYVDPNVLPIRNILAEWSFQNYFVNYIMQPKPGAFWYLQNLILILPFTHLIYYTVRSRYSVVPVTAATLLLFYFGLVPFFSVRFLPYFIFGAWMGIHYPKKIPDIPGRVFSIFCFGTLMVGLNEVIPSDWGGIGIIISYGFQLGIFFFSVSLVRYYRDAWIMKYFDSKLYMSFYLHAAHSTVLSIIGNTLLFGFIYFGIDHTHFWMALPILMFVVTFGLIDLFAISMKKNAPLIFDALSGRRHT